MIAGLVRMGFGFGLSLARGFSLDLGLIVVLVLVLIAIPVLGKELIQRIKVLAVQAAHHRRILPQRVGPGGPLIFRKVVPLERGRSVRQGQPGRGLVLWRLGLGTRLGLSSRANGVASENTGQTTTGRRT
jgi:hypothetical protein